MTKEELLKKNAAIRLARELAKKQQETKEEVIKEEPIQEEKEEIIEDLGSKREDNEEVVQIKEEDIVAIEEVKEEDIPAEAEVIEAVEILEGTTEEKIEQPRKNNRKGGKKPANRKYMVVDDAEILEEAAEEADEDIDY